MEEAGPHFQRVLALNPQHTRAAELLGRTQIRTGHKDLAVQTLTNGYRIAHRKGDMMPMNAMANLLRELGAEVPDLSEKKAAEAGAGGPGGFECRRCGGSGPALKERPFKGELGERILASVCQACWTEWVHMGTKVVNELRLPLHDPAAQEQYDRYMKEFLLLD